MEISKFNLSKYGIEITVLSAYLQKKCNYDTNNFYPISVDMIKDDLCLSYTQQKRLLNELEHLSVIVVKNFGLPSKRHIMYAGEL